MNNIILIGFMGSGKTTIGRLLAEEYSLEYYDIDEFIEENTKLSSPEIFKKAGESWFRDQEAFALTCLTDATNRLIATGGGIVEREENLETLKKGGTVIYLKAYPISYGQEPARTPIDRCQPILRHSESFLSAGSPATRLLRIL